MGPRLLWTRILIIIIAFVAVAGVGSVAIAVDSVSRVQASLSSFERVAELLSNRPGTDLTLDDFQRLDTSVNDLMQTLAATQSRLSFVRPFVGVNADLQRTWRSLDAARQLATAADLILNGLQPTLFFLVAGDDTGTVVTQISSGQRIVELLELGRGQFTNVASHLDNARSIIADLDLSNAPNSAVLTAQQLSSYQNQLSQINTVFLNAPEFLNAALGITGERNYLVLSQNNDELRPSGGYISTYGYLTIRNSRVTGYGYSATSTTSPNPPNADFVSELNIPNWWLRYREPIYAAWDGSWFADFPSTARMAMWYYNTGSNPHSPVEGVIAIDITGFEYLLAVLGDVTVPSYDVTVNAQNFRQVIYDIRAFGQGSEPHKRFLVALYQEIFSQWQNASINTAQNTEILGALLQALKEKHIMLYFNDEQLNQAVDLLGWSGAQAPAVDHDYLMVADANLGNKSNHSIYRSLTYDVDIRADGSVNGRATVSYDYSASVADNDPAVDPEFHGPLDYSNLVQVFVPLNTSLVGATNTPSTPTVVNNTSNTEFVTRLFVPYDSVQPYQFSYTTPPIIDTIGTYKRYRLLLQKQPGTPTSTLSVQVMLPPNARLITASPAPAANYVLDRPILEFRPDFSSDRWIEVIYQD